MIRKRFPAERRRRVVGWTAVAIAWASVAVARISAPEPMASSVPAPAEPEVSAVPSTVASLPTMPPEGLVVLHYTPTPKPTPEVQRVVVTRAAPAPVVVTSSGS